MPPADAGLHEDVGAVQDGVDVEGTVHAAGAADVKGVFLVHQGPADVPVIGILLVPADNIGHGRMVAGSFGDDLQGLVDDKVDIVAYEGKGVHGRHVNAAVPAISVVHHVADLVAVVCGGIDHAGGHDACVVGLDLEVDVIGVRIVQPVARFRRHDAGEDVVTGLAVGMPKRIGRVGEGLGKGFDGGVQAFLGEYFYEGQVHVHIVVQAREAVVPAFDAVFRPGNVDFLVDGGSILEFGGATVGAADDLAGPGAFDLVLEDFFGKGDLGGNLRFAGLGRGRQDQDCREGDEDVFDFHIVNKDKILFKNHSFIGSAPRGTKVFSE